VTSLFLRLLKLERHYPWVLPVASFLMGWLGFVMVRRGEGLARIVAVLALLGWVWLLIEPWIRRSLARRRPRAGNLVVNFVTQSLQQELLFFSLPFLIGATQRDIGQWAFTGLVAAAAVLSTIDPIYERVIAKRAARRMSFHAFCSWIAALVVLPMATSMPVEQALPISLIGATAWLLLTLPMSLPRLGTQLVWIVGMLGVPILFWQLRAQVPAAGLAVTDARITQAIDGLTPGQTVRRVRQEDLAAGVIAFAAIRAPAGLSQEVIFEWRHGPERERIVAEIQGGRADGFRTFSRKHIFGENPAGRWTVDLLTPQEQLLERLVFVIEG
jgi:Family of unknown function (DUF5924)/Protein of unknown function (DUF2914)